MSTHFHESLLYSAGGENEINKIYVHKYVCVCISVVKWHTKNELDFILKKTH